MYILHLTLKKITNLGRVAPFILNLSRLVLKSPLKCMEFEGLLKLGVGLWMVQPDPSHKTQRKYLQI